MKCPPFLLVICPAQWVHTQHHLRVWAAYEHLKDSKVTNKTKQELFHLYNLWLMRSLKTFKFLIFFLCDVCCLRIAHVLGPAQRERERERERERQRVSVLLCFIFFGPAIRSLPPNDRRSKALSPRNRRRRRLLKQHCCRIAFLSWRRPWRRSFR